MIFRGAYFRDDKITQAWPKGDDDFQIDMGEKEGLVFHRTTKEERKAFVDELERRMAYREKQ